MPARKLRSPLSLVVLGLLAEGPLHPYAMRQRISERAHDRLPGVRPASLYDIVRRLAEAGLVSPGEPSREGLRPERVEYVITEAGRGALTDWVTESLADPGRGEEFPAALSFMYPLGRNRVAEILQARAAALAASIGADEAALAEAEAGGVAPVFLSEHRYQLALRRAEHTWLVTFTQALRAGTLSWPTPPGKD
ncbi:MAG TPA: PadR family transcriptional regulator [Trebonia sp.]|nr:PadR family transcriptional regulator [Trebonia sp.]